jgi:hypothetical protein
MKMLMPHGRTVAATLRAYWNAQAGVLRDPTNPLRYRHLETPPTRSACSWTAATSPTPQHSRLAGPLGRHGNGSGTAITDLDSLSSET